MKTARFWTYVNGGWVKLSLRDDQELHWDRYERADEGWGGEERTWCRYGDTVTEIITHAGTDCDGYLSRTDRYACPVTSLAAVPPETVVVWAEGKLVPLGESLPARPEWERVDSVQRDLYAESMGY